MANSDHRWLHGAVGLRIGVAFGGALAVFCIAAVTVVLWVAVTDRGGSALFSVVVVGAEAWWWWRALSVGAALNPDGIVLHGYLRTQRLAWRDVEAVDTEAAEDEWNDFVYVRVRCRGRPRPLKVPGRWNSRAGADRAAAEIRRWRERHLD